MGQPREQGAGIHGNDADSGEDKRKEKEAQQRQGQACKF